MFTAKQFQGFKSGTTSAKDKAEFANRFVKFVESDFDSDLFSKDFYHRLSNTAHHIAHYDRGGFYSAWFEDPVDRVRFIEHWLDYTPVGDPQYTFVDVERVLQKWLRDGDWLNKQTERMQKALAARVEAAAAPDPFADKTELEFCVVARSDKHGAFGHYQYIVCARDGTAYNLHRTLMYLWNVGDKFTVPLRSVLHDDGRRRNQPNWSALSVEIAHPVKKVSPQLLQQIWSPEFATKVD